MQYKYKCLDTNRLKHKPEQLKVKSRNTNANMTAGVGKICWLGQIQARQKKTNSNSDKNSYDDSCEGWDWLGGT